MRAALRFDQVALLGFYLIFLASSTGRVIVPRILQLIRCALGSLFLVAVANMAVASSPSETLLPKTTKGYVSVPNVAKLRESWQQTQIGQLMRDPVMEGFLEDFKAQLQDRFTGLHEKLGIKLQDLEGVPSGEVSAAYVQPTPDTTALVILADVAEHPEEVRELLAKIDDRLIERGASKREVPAHGATMTVYKMPMPEDADQEREAVFFHHRGILCGSDSQQAVTEILGRFSGDSQDSLINQPAFRTVMGRCQEDAGSLAPELRWFIDPFGFVDAIRATKLVKRKKGKDIVRVLKRQGFSAIQGLGGHLNFYVEDKYEVIHRTTIFAPPVEGRADKSEKYELAARMLNFPNSGRLDPLSWVPRDVATYTRFNWKVAKAFDYVETLVDEIILGRNEKGELETGAFKDMIDGIKTDPFGPKIDVRQELIAHLGTNLSVISDFDVPITTKSERLLVAIETTNAKRLAVTIEKNMGTDPNAKQREFEGHIIWEIVEEEDELPELEIENAGLGPPLGIGGFEEEDEEEEGRVAPNSAVCVAYDHLFISSHIDLLKKVLSQKGDRNLLNNTEDYQQIEVELAQMAPGELSFRAFSRTDDEYRPIYELIRAGRMPEAETTLGRILNDFLGEDKEGVLRTQKIDGSKLPDFEMVRRYLGPAGLAVRSEENGWFVIGFTLNKEAP